jgi:SHS family lactate transporter-like MFS transporter
MGGVWGIVVSNALENLPVETRGLASGILAQGYAVGYLVSSIMSIYLNHHTWRVLFWISSGMMAFAAIVRAVLPESQAFLCANSRKAAQKTRTDQGSKSAIHKVGRLLKTHWKPISICVGAIAST